MEFGRTPNEIQQYLDARYVSAHESVWQLMHNELHNQVPAVLYTPLTLSKEDTTVVGTLPLLDNDTTHGHLQSSLHSSPHASPRFACIHLSAHPDPSSPRLTPSPSPRANPIALPSEPQTSPVSMYDASISSAGIWPFLPYTGGGALDDSDSESGSDNNDDDVDGSGSVGKAILSSLPKHRTSSFTTDPRSSTSLTNPHPSLSFSPSPRTTSYALRIPTATSPPVRTSAWRCARANQAPVRSRKASCSFAKDHPTAISRATSVAIGNTTTKTKLRVGFWIGFWIRFGVGPSPPASRTLVRSRESESLCQTAIPHSLFNQTTCKHKKSQLTALELKGRPIANSRARRAW
ncbi:hypothetical protein BU17DRAFT_87997 [Hysterangium stoloniferum]|nr:hypothetical protein BU17DRAFT_87997 [Hysterangium stoloniferum]